MKKSLILGVLMLIAGPPARGQGGLSLEECLRIAREKRPLLSSAGSDVRAARADLGRARSPYYPQLDFTASASRTEVRNRTFNLFARADSWTPASLTATQLLYDFGRTPSAAGSAQSELGASESDLKARLEAVMLDVKSAYFNELRAERSAAVAEETLRQRQELLRITQKRFSEGERPRFDVTRAEIDAERARLDMISAQSGLEVARRILLNAMGTPEAGWRPLEDALEASELEFDEGRLVEATLARRPEIEAQRRRVSSQERLLSSAKREFFPNLSAFGSYDLTSESDNGVFAGQSRTWELGVRARLNVFSGLFTLEGVRKREALLARAGSDLETLVQDARLEVQAALFAMRESRGRIGAAKNLLKSAEENLDLWTKAYHAGKGNIIYVTDAQAQLLLARFGLIDSLADYRVAQARLERAVGAPLSEFPR